MDKRNWLPKYWEDMAADFQNPFYPIRKRFDDIFDDFDRTQFFKTGVPTVRTNVSETDTEICITAELPGMTEDDFEVEVTKNRVVISGEKKSEKEEKGEEDGRQFHRIERSSGSFRRAMSLPYDVDPDKVTAEVKNGILTVTVPKPNEEQVKAQKVKVTKSK